MFITFEGPDGSGKTTQIRLLAERLRAEGCDFLFTREPGGTAIGEKIRDLLHDLNNTAMQPQAEILLYAAARAQLVGEKIKPHLAAGGLVLCDRYADSTLAYQGYGHGLDLEKLRPILNFATQGLQPDLTLLFDLDPEEGLRRRLANRAEWNRLDDYALEFHQRVRQGYLALMKAEPARWVRLDAAQDEGVLAGEVWKVVRGKLKAKG
jgi:dTMP kinase